MKKGSERSMNYRLWYDLPLRLLSTIATFGIGTLDSKSLKISGPFLGIAATDQEVFSSIALALGLPGVFTGSRPLKDGRRFIYTELPYFYSFKHAAVIINRRAFHLTAPGKGLQNKQESAPIFIKEMTPQEITTFNWKYWGDSKRTDAEVDLAIQEFNKLKYIYRLTERNCMHFADAFRDFALGACDHKMTTVHFDLAIRHQGLRIPPWLI